MATGFGIIFFLVYGLVMLALPLACLIGLVWLWVRVLRNKEAGKDARCSACDYSVRGAREFVCVECGADLRVVGIKTPTQSKGVGVVVFLLLWTLLLPMPGCVGAGIMAYLGPKRTIHTSDVTIEPLSGLYNNINIDNMSMGYDPFGLMTFGGMPQMDSVNFYLEDGQGNFGYMGIDAATMTYDVGLHGLNLGQSGAGTGTGTVTVQTGNPRAPFDRAAALAWFSQTSGGGIDITDPAVIAEADELIQILGQFDATTPVTIQTSQFTVSQSFSNTSSIPAGWWIGLVGIFWLGVYVGGIVLYLVIRQRRAKASIPEQDPYGPAQFAPPSPPA